MEYKTWFGMDLADENNIGEKISNMIDILREGAKIRYLIIVHHYIDSAVCPLSLYT